MKRIRKRQTSAFHNALATWSVVLLLVTLSCSSKIKGERGVEAAKVRPSGTAAGTVSAGQDRGVFAARTSSEKALYDVFGADYAASSPEVRKLLEEWYRSTPEVSKEGVIELIRQVLSRGDFRKMAGALLEKLERGNPEGLRAWAAKRIRSSGIVHGDTGVWEGGTVVSFEDLPEAVQNLADKNMFLGAAIRRYRGQGYFVARWGTTVDGMYGIAIGSPSLELPEEMGYRTNCQPGIYAWHTTK